MARLPTLIRTLWYLRPEQWTGQVRRALRHGVVPLAFDGPAPTLALAEPKTPFLGAPGHVYAEDLDMLRMINREVVFEGGIDWTTDKGGPLWTYQLHQFDWARSVRLDPETRLAAIGEWIAHHPSGVGWDAGPTSLRLFAWLKLLLAPGALPAEAASREQVLGSIADQVKTLAANLETHLLGNHYLWNLLALVFAGIVLDGETGQRALAHHTRLLAELDEQFGADGAHYERSPMYHALLLENVLDLVNVLAATPGRGPVGFEDGLRTRAARMVGALQVWTHPDGDVAQFGDTALDFAPRPSQLVAYAGALGIEPANPEPPGVLRQAGFVRLEKDGFVLLATAGVPSPTYQPGHAHSDALSFELSIDGRRVVTDTGVFEYVPGDRRQIARSTAAHATVVIEEKEQSELWAAHRIGGRPDVAWTQIEPGRSATGVCAGWATPEVLHKRTFALEDDGFTIEDRFDVAAKSVVMVLPLAPGLDPDLEGSRVRVPLGAATLRIELPKEAEWEVVSAPAYPEFGKEVERDVLVGRGSDVVAASWKFALEA